MKLDQRWIVTNKYSMNCWSLLNSFIKHNRKCRIRMQDRSESFDNLIDMDINQASILINYSLNKEGSRSARQTTTPFLQCHFIALLYFMHFIFYLCQNGKPSHWTRGAARVGGKWSIAHFIFDFAHRNFLNELLLIEILFVEIYRFMT